MDAIERFDINLDLTNVQLLYDYVECKPYERPASGKWDISLFKGKGTLECVHEDDENGQFRVNLLDKAFSDKRFMEKPSKKKDEVEFELEPSFFCDDARLPKRVIPIHKPGDVIKGSVELVLKNTLKAEKVVVGFLGWAFVKILTSNGKTCYDVYGTRKYVKEKVPLWINMSKDRAELSDKFTLLGPDGLGGVPRGSELQPGSHKFPFEFAVPFDTPQSTPALVIHSHNQGHLVYRLKASIDKGNSGSRGNIVTHRGIWVRKPVDIAANPANLEPVEIDQSFETGKLAFWKSGKIAVKVMLPKTAFHVGEPLGVTIEIDNDSKGVINAVTACIRMHGRARVGDSRMSVRTGINIKSVKAEEGPVAPGMCPVFRMSIPWDFSESSADGNLLPVGDLSDCPLLDIEYEIRVKLNRKGLHRNMEFAIPITVGNVNSMSA